MERFPVIDVEGDPLGAEPVGSKAMDWFAHPDGRHMLFKRARPGTGEHWAERVAAELAGRLGLPHALYDLAQLSGERGVVSWSFLRNESGERLGSFVVGNEILAGRISGYPTTDLRRRSRPALHTIEAVLAACDGVPPPALWPAPDGIDDGADVFVGYLLLDAWIGNTDRHDRNWGWIDDPAWGPACMAPTFDHASSLGRELTDADRAARLDTRDAGYSVDAYALRARSPLFRAPLDRRPLSPIEGFRTAAALRPQIARLWMARLSAVPEDAPAAILDCVPDGWISDEARRFACRLLEITRRHLLAEGGDEA